MESRKSKNKTSKIFDLYAKYGQKSFIFTLICIAWLVWRISTKPSRINYPCTQFALWQTVLYFGIISPALLQFFHKCMSYIRQKEYIKIAGIVLVILLVAGTFSLYEDYSDNQLRTAGSGIIPRPTDFNSRENTVFSESIDQYHGFSHIVSPDSAVVSFSYDPLVDYGGASPYDPEFNPAYDFVWETVAKLQLGSSINPLDDLINEGDIVLIKPNWVDYGPAVYTRPEVVRPLIDMAVAAGAATIYIGDGGGNSADTVILMNDSGYAAMANTLNTQNPGTHIEAINLNSLSHGWHWVNLSSNSSFAGSGYTQADLAAGGGSLFGHEYYETPDSLGANPEGEPMGWYAISDKILDADVIINVPKMKTHQTMIATMSIKNLVGCTIGSTYDESSGDCQSRIPHYGMWEDDPYFNNGVFWRSILDMNKILLYTDENGVMQDTQQRKYLNIVDGIQAMERSQHHVWGGGGLPYDRQVILAGIDPVAVDAVGCRIMGYDFRVIPLISNADSDIVHPIGTNAPDKIVIIGDEINLAINHVFAFNTAWDDDAEDLNLGITDFTPPSIDLINREGDTVTANIFECLSAYIFYEADGVGYIEKMTKDGDIYTGAISSTTSKYQIIAQDDYLNTVQSEPETIEDIAPPYTSGHSPAPGANGVPVDTNIVVHVLDDGDGVDISSIDMTVEGVPVTPVITGAPADYTITYDPPVDFDYLQVVDVTIDASDMADPANVMTQDAFSFTTAQVEYTLTVSIIGNGNVERDDPGPYNYGDVVQLTAVPESGWNFSGWSGDLDGTLNPENLTMNSDKTVTATFTSTSVISGLTAEVNGNVITGATVKLYLDGVLQSTTTSSPDGQYELIATEIDEYTVVVSAAGFKKETQEVSITSLDDTYTLDFIGNSGLIPQAPSLSYVLNCANHWLFPPVNHPELALSMSKVLAVANAYLYH
jgi:uncharacterized protein (DUF362 family)